MVKLLVSKINNIKVLQVDESRLTVSHKKAKANKPLQGKNKDGANYSVDLGAGARVHTIKIHTLYKNETEKLFNILYNKRDCEVVDKFFGKIKVFIDKVEIVNSDKHIGKTVFNVTATVQDLQKAPQVNATAQLKNTIEDFEKEIATKAQEFADEIETVDTVVDALTNAENFVDSMLDTIENGVQQILDLEFIAFDFYNKIKSKVNRIKRIGETLKLITSLPQAFVDLLLETTNTETAQNVGIFETVTKNGKVVKTLNDDLSEYSQFEVIEIKKSVKTNQLLNLVTATGEMKQALNKKYKSQQEFDAQIKTCIKRLESTPLSYEKIVIAQQTLKRYSNDKKVKKIVDLEVKEPTPLVAIVFGLYGNIDDYDAIRTINNFADNDAVNGTIKVYDYASVS